VRALLPILVGLSVSCGAGRKGVVVCAAASLREVVTEIGDRWAAAAGVRVEYRFDASDLLARQIAEGAPADLFVSADPALLDRLSPIDRMPWLGNRLVCVRRRGGTVAGLAAARSLALGSEGSPIGRYAAAALGSLGIAAPARTIRGANVRDVLSKVAEGAAELGIVYATDVAVDPRVEIAFPLPDPVQPEVVYAVALLAERARPLFRAMREPDAIAAATGRGFVPRR
jgi:molybdate transport system substrate-binding protein